MNSLTFLGTGGTRYVMITQRRHTGGLWFSTPSGDWIIDPGPGALIRALEAEKQHRECRGLVVTHCHIDHTSDLAVSIEALSAGGRSATKYPLLAGLPPEQDGEPPLIPPFLLPRLSKIFRWPESIELPVGRITAQILDHGVPCWALRFDGFDGSSWGLLSDSRLVKGIGAFFQGCRTLVANVTLLTYREPVMHLGSDQLGEIMEESGVQRLYMTHMGDWLLDYPPERRAAELTTDRCQVVAACDGMTIEL